MAEFGYNLQASTFTEFIDSTKTLSLAKSRAQTFNAGAVVTSLSCYHRPNQGGAGMVNFWLFSADETGEAEDLISGPHTVNASSNGFIVTTIGGLSITIPATGDYTILCHHSHGHHLARGAAAVECSRGPATPGDPFVESGTETFDLAIWGENTPAPSLSITAPNTIEDGVATTIAGTDLDTVQSVTLDVDGSNYSVSQSFVIDVDEIDFTPETNFGEIAAQPTAPFTDATLFTGAVADVVRLGVNDGADDAYRNVTNTTPAGHDSYKFGDVSGANTAPGSGSLLSSDYIIAEDGMQVVIETPVDGVDLALDAQGNWSSDAAGLEALQTAGSIDIYVAYIMPSTGNISGMVLTIDSPNQQNGLPASGVWRSPWRGLLRAAWKKISQ